ncbi:Cilia- and flagella-associated protein 157 [Caenorhabditis elegans]|uniref:Cilia- and flagella-associated protein 157 n=1 Tax=Caenorhabditis elegans TaxID=6239 RepID=F5GUF1_CAEEL|nr:Cilia- and flagella-associated protein 157 [Caenorhabditis elegans]CCA65620.1 Cilia- and flagella-associated protein 157 [Caenorhabditis elegans]|eukprot:NP_001251433.1 Uncharacterized protein CELE_T22A3.12 [Caenorhabditis elegans]
MSTNEFERIDSLAKICDDHEKNLRRSLENVSQRNTEVSELMSLRLHQITQKMGNLRSKFDSVHTHNQKLLEKIKEKLDEIDAQEMEANREYDDFRRNVTFAKRQHKKNGIIRALGHKIYNYGITILIFIGWYKPPKKPAKSVKKCSIELPRISPSQHTITGILPEKSKSITATAPKISPTKKKLS